MITGTLRVIIGLILCVTLVLLPSGIAVMRRHKNLIPIILVNVLLGITGIGWIIALIWSFTSNVKEKRSIIELIKALKDGSVD
ncbi:MAG: superinfection immunity protein [Micavibrio sp.]|nr:superinfection immunity protein [Micavibrio sp.]